MSVICNNGGALSLDIGIGIGISFSEDVLGTIGSNRNTI